MWRGKCFRLAFAFFQAQLFSCQCLLFTNEKKMHYCGPDGNIPHDQTNQSPWWDAGVTQPCSNTPFHSLSGTNTWSPINGTPRTHEEGCISTVSLVHGWWLHNHTFILSKEKGDELPNNISHHVNTNTVIDAAFVKTVTRSPRCITHSRLRSSPAYSDNLRWGGAGQGDNCTVNKLKKYSVARYQNQASVHHQGVKMLNNRRTAKQQKDEVKDKEGYTHGNADPAPNTLGIFPYTEIPCKSHPVYS